MQDQMAYLADEQQACLGAAVLSGVPTPGARLAGLGGSHVHRQTAREYGFLGDLAVQLRKRTLRGMAVGSAPLHRRLLAILALGALAEVRQVLQADEAMRVGFHRAPANHVVAILLQPPLPPRKHHQKPCRRTGALLLQALPQTGKVVRLGAGLSARKARGLVLYVHRLGQVALAHVYADSTLLRLRSGVSYLDLQAHQQREQLVGLVLPELGRADLRPPLNERHMARIAGAGQNQPPVQTQETHMASLEAVVVDGRVDQCRRPVLWRLVQSARAPLGVPRHAGGRIGLHLCPPRLVGGPH